MNKQVGWAGLVERMKNEAPRYVQLLPELPRLLHQALQPRGPAQERALEALLLEQRHTNGLLRIIISGALGVLLGLAGALMFLHWH
jgi:ubiquinone biosynthesis protein